MEEEAIFVYCLADSIIKSEGSILYLRIYFKALDKSSLALHRTHRINASTALMPLRQGESP
ncbi:MAG: hypothetical protein KDK76_06475 [Chlamydiia bacterium]|nr:hypothetical protein [Chlamydiia bacterium]